MEKFKELKKIGDGSFGTVTKAMNTQTNELVAIKKMKQKYSSWDECMNLRELKALRKLMHPNIIKLKEALQKVIRLKDELSFVFEFAEKNVYQAYTQYKDQGKYMPENEIKAIMHQCTSALSYMHKHGFFHRDLKPENILVNDEGVLKLIDFGLAREIRSRPPYTDYVATRWYRAPEILLKQTNYNSPVDIFALGCIMCELYLNRPMFSGNSEMDQLNKLLSVLGTFSQLDWSEGHRLVSQKGMTLAQFPQIQLNSIVTNASSDAINLIVQMLKWDPNKRITAAQMLLHPYFQNSHTFLPQALAQSNTSKSPLRENITLQQQPQQQQLQQQQPQQQQNIQQNNLSQNNIQSFALSQGQKDREKAALNGSQGHLYPPLPSSKQRQRGTQPQQNILSNGYQYEGDSGGSGSTYQPSFGSIKLQRNIEDLPNEQQKRSNNEWQIDQQATRKEGRGEIDEMLDLVNSTTNENRQNNQRSKHIQQHQQFSLEPQHSLSYQPLNNQKVNPTKSSLRLNRQSVHDESANYGISQPNKDRDNSIGQDLGGYLPSQMQKPKIGNSSGLQMPQQQTQQSKQSYQNSIYNFDNVATKQDQSFRMRQQQGGPGIQNNKQF